MAFQAAEETMTSTLEKVQSKIRARLDSEPGGVFTEAQLQGLLLEHRQKWGLASSITGSKFIEFLVQKMGLRNVELRSEKYEPRARFGWGEYSPYVMGLSLRPRSYLSHGTAILLHALNEQLPKTIYVNQEQSEKPPGGKLSQARLTLAFTNRQRMSTYIYSVDGFRIVLLSGKQTHNLGVDTVTGPAGEKLLATGLARTLIDIVVRPAYAGGIVQVLEAYRSARGRVQAAEIVEVLGKLDYVYPYHQAIGFLMERAGFVESECERLRRLGTKYEFYLLHGMKQPQHDPKWRLYFPQGV